jgi:outer membrane protein TolC
MAGSSAHLAKLAEDRERVGAGSDVDSALARANAFSLEDAQAQAEFARDQALRALELLLGRYPAAEISASQDFVAMPPAPPVDVPLAMLERRPDVIAAERRVAAAFYRVEETKAARLPTLKLTGSLSAISSDLVELTERDDPVWGWGGRSAVDGRPCRCTSAASCRPR